MSSTYLIEVGDTTAWIVVADVSGFRFYSALRRFSHLDGRHFRNPHDAERAARRLTTRAAGLAFPRLGELS